MKILHQRFEAARATKRAIVALAMRGLIPIRMADRLVATLGLAHA